MSYGIEEVRGSSPRSSTIRNKRQDCSLFLKAVRCHGRRTAYLRVVIDHVSLFHERLDRGLSLRQVALETSTAPRLPVRLERIGLRYGEDGLSRYLAF